MDSAEETVDNLGAHVVAFGSYVKVSASAHGCILKDLWWHLVAFIVIRIGGLSW